MPRPPNPARCCRYLRTSRPRNAIATTRRSAGDESLPSSRLSLPWRRVCGRGPRACKAREAPAAPAPEGGGPPFGQGPAGTRARGAADGRRWGRFPGPSRPATHACRSRPSSRSDPTPAFATSHAVACRCRRAHSGRPPAPPALADPAQRAFAPPQALPPSRPTARIHFTAAPGASRAGPGANAPATPAAGASTTSSPRSSCGRSVASTITLGVTRA
jgi:hypothetical protein